MARNQFDVMYETNGFSEWEKLLDINNIPTEDSAADTSDVTEKDVQKNKAGEVVVQKLLSEFIHPNDGTFASGYECQTYFPDDIHLMTASHERRLLVEPYEHVIADGSMCSPRPCAMGEECLGRSNLIKQREQCGGGRILMECLFTVEYDAFLRTGQLPQTTKCCVLCMRQHILSCFLWSLHTDTEKIQKRCLTINPYVNPKGCADGYSSTIPFDDKERACMMGPVAVNKLNEFFWVKKNNHWTVDQSAIEYKNPNF